MGKLISINIFLLLWFHKGFTAPPEALPCTRFLLYGGENLPFSTICGPCWGYLMHQTPYRGQMVCSGNESRIRGRSRYCSGSGVEILRLERLAIQGQVQVWLRFWCWELEAGEAAESGAGPGMAQVLVSRTWSWRGCRIRGQVQVWPRFWCQELEDKEAAKSGAGPGMAHVLVGVGEETVLWTSLDVQSLWGCLVEQVSGVLGTRRSKWQSCLCLNRSV